MNLFTEAFAATLALNIMFALAFHTTYLTGQLSFGHAAFASIGGYFAGVLTTRYGIGLWLALPGALLVGFTAGLVVALPALRTRHVNLAILTFGIMQIVAYLFGEWDFVGGLGGLNGMVGITAVHLVAIMLLMVFATWWLERSRLGLAMRAVRRDALAAGLMGIATAPLRILSFGIGAAMAALAGALYGHYNFFIEPGTFGISVAVNMVYFAIVGGTQSFVGPVVGAVLLSALPELLRDVMSSIDFWRPVINSALIIVMLMLRPEGLVRRHSRKARPGAMPSAGSAPLAAARLSAVPALSLQGLSKQFGGVAAIADITLEVRAGEVLGLIGPNGAGKTTLFNLITGIYRPNAGRLQVDGVDVTGLSSHRIARQGVARTFQNIRLFGDLTVAENIAAVQRAQGRSASRLRDDADQLLQLLGIAEVRNRFARELSYATQRRVEFARALALRPKVLLLDEPTAGMDDAETDEIAHVIRIANRRLGCAVVLVEHDMNLVMQVCDRIAVLDFGKMIAEGTPNRIQNDPAVQSAYLGQQAAA